LRLWKATGRGNMSNVVSLRPKRVRAPKHIGAFFELGPTYANGDHGLELENGDKLITPPRVMLGPGAGQKYGFPEFPEAPRLRPDKKDYDRPPKDLEQFHLYWLISQRLKDVLERVDPAGVSLADCEVFHISGKPIGPRHHLCDVVREVDALDEAASNVAVRYIDGEKLYSLGGDPELSFKRDVLGGAHIFRQKNMGGVFCDALLKQAIVDAGIKNPLHFCDVSIRI
jgi:catechol 2,3-dioxygenase-like lactoylglutathione lyase family enzyme